MTGHHLVYRVRVPKTHRANPRGRIRRCKKKINRKHMKGGFLPFLAPIIAAAVGSIPAIASVALQASRK
nr:MAG: pX protein [unidentified adenovirus]